jgi:hypothetical protein
VPAATGRCGRPTAKKDDHDICTTRSTC